MQEISKLLQHLKSWLTEQQRKLESLKPAAVSAVLVSDQITENEVRTTILAITMYYLIRE